MTAFLTLFAFSFIGCVNAAHTPGDDGGGHVNVRSIEVITGYGGGSVSATYSDDGIHHGVYGMRLLWFKLYNLNVKYHFTGASGANKLYMQTFGSYFTQSEITVMYTDETVEFLGWTGDNGGRSIIHTLAAGKTVNYVQIWGIDGPYRNELQVDYLYLVG